LDTVFETNERLGTTLQTYYLESGRQNEGVSKKEIMNRLMQQGPFIDYFDGFIISSESVIEYLKIVKEVNSELTKTIDIELMHIE